MRIATDDAVAWDTLAEWERSAADDTAIYTPAIPPGSRPKLTPIPPLTAGQRRLIGIFDAAGFARPDLRPTRDRLLLQRVAADRVADHGGNWLRVVDRIYAAAKRSAAGEPSPPRKRAPRVANADRDARLAAVLAELGDAADELPAAEIGRMAGLPDHRKLYRLPAWIEYRDGRDRRKAAVPITGPRPISLDGMLATVSDARQPDIWAAIDEGSQSADPAAEARKLLDDLARLPGDARRDRLQVLADYQTAEPDGWLAQELRVDPAAGLLADLWVAAAES